MITILRYFIFAILITQFINGDEIKPISSSISSTVHDKYNQLTSKLVLTLEGAFHEAIQEGSTIAQNVHQQLSTLIQRVNNSVINDVTSLSTETLNKIQILKEEASEIGQEALECVIKEEHRVPASEKQAISANEACFTKLKVKADELVGEAVDIPVNAYEVLADLRVDWDDCASWWLGSIWCRKGVVSNLCKKLEVIGKEANELVQNMIGFEVNELLRVLKCVDGNLVQFKSSLNEIVVDIEHCIDNVI